MQLHFLKKTSSDMKAAGIKQSVPKGRILGLTAHRQRSSLLPRACENKAPAYQQ